MTPHEMASLTAAKLEHEGHEVSEAELREIEREIMAGARRQECYRNMMRSPSFQWRKPTQLRR
ncbi:hypothetical protein FFB58_10435 [Enterobacter sp. MF024]|nr:hypothetical protein [Enterobacter sp. MF024]TLU68628.1 hypothetical protein FFB58_10435 [Enterobacter sp. MF024]